MTFLSIVLLVAAVASYALNAAVITRRQALARWGMLGDALTAVLLIAGLLNLAVS